VYTLPSIALAVLVVLGIVWGIANDRSVSRRLQMSRKNAQERSKH
jgi:hypothetical protein